MQLRFLDRKVAISLFVLAGVAAGGISWAAGQSQNLDVFRAASRALLDGHDLYAKNAADYFKYSPTFAFLFLPLMWVPGWLSAVLWGALNFGLVAVGLDKLFDDRGPKRLAMGIALAGIVVATDGDQSNLLVTGGVLLALVAYERGRLGAFAHLVAALTLVKLFPFALGVLVLLLVRSKRPFAVLLLLSAFFAWIALPLVVLPPHALAEQYASWYALLGRDHGNHGWSVMSFLQDGLHVGLATTTIQLAAIVVQATPVILGVRFGTDRSFRRTLVCSLLAFAVLFNHRAEYATFAISAVAVGVWYASAPAPRSNVTNVLVVLAILAPGPFFTHAQEGTHGIVAFLAAHRLFHPLRVVPLLVLWCRMQHELLARFFEVRVRVRAFAGGHDDAS